MKKIYYSVTMLFVFSSIISCSIEREENNGRNEEEKIIPLDTIFSMNTTLDYYLPENIKSQTEIRTYFNDYLEVGEDAYSDYDDGLNSIADTSVWSLLTSFGTTTWKLSGFFKLEDKRGGIKTKYSKTIIDTFNLVEDALNNYFYYSYINYFNSEMDNIKNHKSIRSVPSGITEEFYTELNFNKTKELFLDLQEESARIKKILIFNELLNPEYKSLNVETELINSEIKDISTFFISDDSEYQNVTILLKKFWYKLSKLKSDLQKKKNILSQNESIWNDKTIIDLEGMIYIYEESIKKEIANLNVYEQKKADWDVF